MLERTSKVAKLLFAPLLLLTGAAHADSLSPKSHPSNFCTLAADLGYPQQSPFGPDKGCSSVMTPVTRTPGKNRLRNNLAFYVSNDLEKPDRLDHLTLILNVNNPREKTSSYNELSRVATALVRKLTGSVPDGLAAAIRKPYSRTWPGAVWTTEVKYTVWPTGLGNDVTVYFRPSGH